MKKSRLIALIVMLCLGLSLSAACNRNTCRYEEKTVAATCTRDGYTAKICVDCGEELSGSRVVLPALGHSLSEVEGKEATCSSDGYTAHKKCSRCDYAEGYAVLKAEHTYEYVDGKAATCTEDGYSAHKKCSVCGFTLHKTEIKAAHKFYFVSGKNATCTEDGYSAHEKCSVCGFEENKEIIPAGHTFADVKGKNATCTENGCSDYKKCTVCGVETDKNIIPASHSFIAISGKSATCREDGYSAYEKCEICGFEQGKTIEKARHTFVEVEAKDATCTTSGYTAHEQCSECGVTVNKIIIPAGHKFTEVEAKAATCTSDGYTRHEECSVCGMTKNKTVIKAHHSFVTVPEKNATCAEPGNNSYEKCSLCGEERNKQILTAPHAFAWIAAKNATCTEDGYSAYRKCKVCGTETDKTIIKAGHEMADKPGRDATCTEDGFTPYKKCLVCGIVVGKETIKAAHNYVVVPAKEATCTEDGYTEYEKCARCGREENKTFVKAAHEFIAVSMKEATCTEDGYTAHELCTKCGYTIGKDVIKASHDFVTVPAKGATCAEPGYNRHLKCSKCGQTEGKIEIKAAHKFLMIKEKLPDCTTGGYSEYKKCSVCGFEEEKVTLDALGHSFGTFVVKDEATCTRNETEQAECSRCGYVEVREVENSKLPHKYVKKAEFDENGMKAYVCDVCSYKDMRKPVRVIVLSGQSNAVGYSVSKYLKSAGSTIDAARYDKFRNGFDNVYIRYNNNDGASDDYKHTTSGDKFVNVKLGQGVGLQNPAQYPDGAFGAEIGMAELWEQIYPGEALYVIKYAYGGTSIYNEWCSPSAAANEGRETGVQYAKMADYVRTSIAILEQMNLAPELEAFVWMQGESDSTHYFTYYNRYDSFVTDVRAEFDDYETEKGLAFIDGGISEHWSGYEKINDVKNDYSQAFNRNYFVDTIAAGLTFDKDNNDYAHFDAEPMITLGNLFGQKFIESLENDEILTRNNLVSDGVSASEKFAGYGTEGDPYLLACADDWMLLANKISSGESFAGKFFKVTENVKLTHPSFNPIGVGEFNYDENGVKNEGAFFANGEEKLFAGHLNGNGKQVKIRFCRSERAVGLFRGIAPGGVIENLTVYGDVYVTDGAKWIASALAAYNGGTIENCVNYASITAFSRQAGIAARNVGTVKNCVNYGEIKCNSNDCRVGGIVGEATKGSLVENCVNNASVTGKLYVGGVVGVSKYGTIVSCDNIGKVSGNRFVSGICSYMTANKLSDCENRGDVVCLGALPAANAEHQCIAGVCAYAEASSTIEKCNNYATITGEKMVFIAGGIAAHVKNTSIKECSNFGDVISADDALGNDKRGYIAGVVGWAESSSAVYDCKNEGLIKNVFFRSGGVAGYLNASTADKLVNGKPGDENAGRIVFSSVKSNCCRNGGVVGELKSSTLGSENGTGTSNFSYGFIENMHMWNGCVVGVADNSSIYGCENRGSYTYKTGTYDVGGILGHVIDKTFVKIGRCVNYGACDGKYNVGGIVGYALSTTTISNCENYGEVTSLDSGKCSGISGNKAGTIADCTDHAA